MKISSTYLWLPFLIVMVFVPMMAWANPLIITDVVVPDKDTSADEANVQVYFNLRSENGMAVTGITPENCQIEINSKTPEVKKAEIKPFIDGNKGVAVVFIFPNSNKYSEEAFGIRSTLTTLSMEFSRPIDMLNAIPYDVQAKPTGWSIASKGNLREILEHMKTTDSIEQNLFMSFSPAIAVLKNMQTVSQKYVVIISDAEGAVFDDKGRAIANIAEFVDELKRNNITPIVIGYSPDGPEAMPNVDLLKRIANMADGIYFQADNLERFQQIVQKEVYDYIFKQYIYQATIDMSGKNYLEKGKYDLVLKVNNEKASMKIDWPKLNTLDHGHVGILIALVLGLIVGFGTSLIIRDKKKTKA